MNQRDLSEKLDELAQKLERLEDHIRYDLAEDIGSVETIAQELRKLSKENYVPGNSLSWDAVKPNKPTKKTGFVSKGGKRMPF